MVKTKVFVGNLSFKTAEADLAKEFEVAGKVASTNIISRGSRSLGYGFVEMESEEEARKAVETLNKKQLDGREINVELAKPTDENAVKEERKPRAPRAPRPPRAGANAANNGQAGQAGEGEGEGEGAARRRRPQNRPRRPRRAQNADGAPAAAGEAGAPAAGGAAPKPRRERAPRLPRTDAPRVAAPNTLFVANLPFSIDDAGLSQIFAGLNLKTAHVVRKRNNRSKGFGFAEFNNEDEQKKALAATDKKSVEGRELIVKLARTGEPVPADETKKEAAPASPKTA